MDTGLFCFRRNFHATHSYAADLASIGHFINQVKKIMFHWQKVLSLPILEVHYEELVSNFEKISKQVVNFCGLDWEAGVLEFYRSHRTVKTASYDQVRQPLYQSSIGIASKYEKQLTPLKNTLS